MAFLLKVNYANLIRQRSPKLSYILFPVFSYDNEFISFVYSRSQVNALINSRSQENKRIVYKLNHCRKHHSV